MCECVERVNEQLEQYNARIKTPWLMNGTRSLCVVTEKIDSSKRIVGMAKEVFSTYCPFCGVLHEKGEPVIPD